MNRLKWKGDGGRGDWGRGKGKGAREVWKVDWGEPVSSPKK